MWVQLNRAWRLGTRVLGWGLGRSNCCQPAGTAAALGADRVSARPVLLALRLPLSPAVVVIPIHVNQNFLAAPATGNVTVAASTLMDLTMANMQMDSTLLWWVGERAVHVWGLRACGVARSGGGYHHMPGLGRAPACAIPADACTSAAMSAGAMCAHSHCCLHHVFVQPLRAKHCWHGALVCRVHFTLVWVITGYCFWLMDMHYKVGVADPLMAAWHCRMG